MIPLRGGRMLHFTSRIRGVGWMSAPTSPPCCSIRQAIASRPTRRSVWRRSSIPTPHRILRSPRACCVRGRCTTTSRISPSAFLLLLVGRRRHAHEFAEEARVRYKIGFFLRKKVGLLRINHYLCCVNAWRGVDENDMSIIENYLLDPNSQLVSTGDSWQ